MTSVPDSGGMDILQKCGAIIAALQTHGEETAQGLAEHVGEPVSSTYRLLASLTSIGWVDAGTRRGYFRLGVKFLRVGSLLEDQLSVRDASRPALDRLRGLTHATTFLCVLRGDAAVCVERLAGRDVQSLAMRLGDSLPLFRGAAPLALFAFLPDSEQTATFERLAARRRNGEDIPSVSELRATLELTHERGYSLSDQDVTPGIAAIGAPIFNHRGELEAAISVSGLRDQILEESNDVAEATMAAAAEASRALGALEGASR